MRRVIILYFEPTNNILKNMLLSSKTKPDNRQITKTYVNIIVAVVNFNHFFTFFVCSL